MNSTPSLRSAQLADVPSVRQLLTRCDLPCDGIEDQFVDSFVVADHDGELIGVAGVERYGHHGLLRSVAVAEAYRGRSVGRQLIGDCLRRARRRGIDRVYLLTIDAQGYFQTLGFTAIDREQVPEDIAESGEFVSICPATATVMVLMQAGLSRLAGDNAKTGESR